MSMPYYDGISESCVTDCPVGSTVGSTGIFSMGTCENCKNNNIYVTTICSIV